MAKAALLGIGTVGSGAAELLRDNAEKIAASLGQELELKYILAAREHPDSPFAGKIIHDFSLIENDPEISVVAECIGGVGAAYDYVRRSLLAGKSVVTSNKELVAEKGLELLGLARERGLMFLFEGSVGGGIPVIRPLSQCLAGERISEISGILNGTTNYILTQMLQCGQSFENALAEAQALGYAEADPSADVEGLDACRKICILADLGFGRNVEPALVSTQGISSISAADAAFAGELGYSIKLLGRAVELGGRLCVYVAPHLVAGSQLLSNVSGVMNAVVVKGSGVGQCMFYGPGAGKLPTGSAVVADMMEAVRRRGEDSGIDWAPGDRDMLMSEDELPSRWYVRLAAPCRELSGQWLEKDGSFACISESLSRRRLKELLPGKPEAAMRVMD